MSDKRKGLLASNVGDTNKDAPFPSRGRKGEWVGLSVNPLDATVNVFVKNNLHIQNIHNEEYHNSSPSIELLHTSFLEILSL